MRRVTVAAVIEKLGVDRPTPSLAGLRTVYAAWCELVPFDNVLKLVHLSEGRPGLLPGSTSESFFEAWLEHGTGGTCWAGNGALHDLLEALGFDVAPALATMLSAPGTVGPNHGTVIADVGDGRWIVDASILSGEPIRYPRPKESQTVGLLPASVWLNGRPTVLWRTLAAPEGFPCRIDRIPDDAEEWDALHQRTAVWSPFNFGLNARTLRGAASVGIASGMRFTIDRSGLLSTTRIDRDGRIRFLVDELGISEEIASRVPDDCPMAPRPDGT